MREANSLAKVCQNRTQGLSRGICSSGGHRFLRAGGVDWCREASKSTAGGVRAIVGEMNPRTEEDDDIFVKL